MKMKGMLNKGIASVLSAALIMGLTPAIPDMSIKSYADEAIDTTPSVQAYADKDTLMGDAFAPDKETGKSDNIGLLYFGKNGNGVLQKWYILGKDNGVKDENGNDTDNIAIFAAFNITSLAIYKDRNSHNYIGDKDEVYVTESETPSSVDSNHYGESDIRQALRNMAGDEGTDTYNYFTATEKTLMQKTKVLTHEYSNNHLYTTNDKLYLASGDISTQNIINVGNVSESAGGCAAADEYTSIKLYYKNYWGSSSKNDLFWLRSPATDSANSHTNYNTHYAWDSAGWIGLSDVEAAGSIRPASNLNLSSVLFASAAPASTNDTQPESGADVETYDITDDAMSLRLDGGDEISESIGTVYYSKEENAVIATKGDTNKKVSLIIQGKTDDKDWYISETVTDNCSVKLGSDHDVAQCKIWLEIPVDDASALAYAVEAKEHDNHTFNEEGHCTVCGYDVSVTDWEYKKPVAATCKDNGKEEYWIYNVNGSTKLYRFTGEYDTPAFGVKEKKLEQFTDMNDIKTDLDPDNHVDQSNDYKPYAKEYVKVSALKHKIICSGCSTKLGTASHDFVDNKCKDCGYIKSSNSSGGGSSGSSSGGSSYSNTGWVKDSKGWKYRNSYDILAQGTTVTDADGNKVEKILWEKVGDKYFAIGSDGYLKTGWIYDGIENKWSYCDENNGRLSGWFYEPNDGYWYYLSPSTGEALTGWQNINGKNYYFAGMPSVPTYSFDAETDTWVYSNTNGVRPFGAMYANTVTPDNYQVDANGAWIH